VAAERRLAAIVYTDIVGYTSLSQQDEGAALRLVQDQERLAQGLLPIHHGRKVKSMGDGLLLEFPDALEAVEYAVDFQRHLSDRNARRGSPPLLVRIGIHVGDVESFGSDILGDAVNVASRIYSLAEPGGVCLSEQVYAVVRNKVNCRIDGLGPKKLKGVQDPVEVYRVELPWTAAAVLPTNPTHPRLAVLPFANISPDPKDEFFADGLTEELISVISQIRGVRVTSRTSVSQFKASSKSLSQIGKELGVHSVLEGSVRKSGDRLRITVQLIDVQTDEHRWTQTYDRKLDDVFAIQAEIAELTARTLKVELLRSERESVSEAPTTNLAAYEAYLRGVQASLRFYGRTTEQIDREAERYFEEAIREDPKFVAAYARLAHHLIVAAGETRSWTDVTARIRELVAKAIELDPNSSDAHLAQGSLAWQVDHEWARGEAELQQAIALNPSSSEARCLYGWGLAYLQRFEEARTQFLVAIEQDPLNLRNRTGLAWTQVFAGDYQSAITSFQKLVKDDPDNPGIRGELASVYAIVGRANDALKTMEPLATATDLGSRAWRGHVEALLGRPEEARSFLVDWEGGRLSGPYALDDAALQYAVLGENERALALLERDDREQGKSLWVVYLYPELDPIRDDPRFVALLRGLNLPTTLSRPRWSPGRTSLLRSP